MSGEVEQGECNFCHDIKPVNRTYLYPSKYVKPEKFEDRDELYNQGDYFIIIRTCNDCGEPKI